MNLKINKIVENKQRKKLAEIKIYFVTFTEPVVFKVTTVWNIRRK